MRNAEIAKVFQNIADLLELKGENPFKIRAYQRAVFSIEHLPEELSELVRESRLKEIPGVGEAIAGKITELISTGRLKYYDDLKAEFPAVISALLDVPGIDPKTAMRLGRELNIKSIDELEAVIAEGKVASLPCLGEKTAENLLHHLQTLRRKDKRIPPGEALDFPPTITGDIEAIRYLEQAIRGGRHWYLALLEAIGKWAGVEEIFDDYRYRYLIAGEAFDLLLLAGRLCRAVEVLLPGEEKLALLFREIPPLKLAEGEFKDLIGSRKYRQYLNYFYGVTVEEALFLAVQDEVRKERRAAGFSGERDIVGETCRRLYGATKSVLLRRFRKEKGYPQLKSISLSELKEFTYWLFKNRLQQSEKARVASDTKKALLWLSHRGSLPRGLITHEPPRY